MVPSFSSFPQFEERTSEPNVHPPGKRDRRKPKSSHSSKTNAGKNEKRERRHASESSHGEEKQQAEDFGTDDTHRFFFSDRRPDPLNLQYGGLHVGDVPKYRLVAGGRNILGLQSSLVVIQRSGKGIVIGISNQRKLSNLTDSYTRALLSVPPTRRLLKTNSSKKYDEIDGFIRLPARRGKTASDDSYRLITNPKNGGCSDSESSQSDGPDDDVDDVSLDEENMALPDTPQQGHLRALEQDLALNPQSAQSWIRLINHTLSSIPITSKNATKARCDITISILSRAFAAHAQNLQSKVLRIKYLKAGEEIWHEGKLRAEWEDALVMGGVETWIEWIEWKFRQIGNSVDRLLDDVSRAMGGVGDDEIGKVRIFWRTSVALKNAGFSERATAMFQAQMELAFGTPPSLSSAPFETILRHVEEFWESETIRIGEEGAKGWKSWYNSGKSTPPSVSTATSITEAVLDLDPYRQWAAQEATDDRRSVLPSRSGYALDADLDPYSTVLFSDIRPTLFNMQTSHAKKALRIAFLSFLGLQVPGFSASLSINQEMNWDDRWNMGHITQPTHLQAIFANDRTHKRIISEAVVGAVVGREKDYNSSFSPVKSWSYGVFQPLDAVTLPPGNPQILLWSKLDAESVNRNLVRQVFSQLRLENDDFQWDSFALAFEVAINVKRALKLSKTFLSDRRDSLYHWGAHAQLERLNGRMDGSRKVYQTVLISSKPTVLQAGASQLWWSWAQMEWLEGEEDKAVNVVLRSVGVDTSRSDVAVLRANRMLEERISSALHWKDREAWIKLRALLELKQGEGIRGMLAVFDDHRPAKDDISVYESFTVTCLLFLYYHAIILKNAMPPALLRDRARDALVEYPSNSVILGIFLEGEKGQGIWGNVRAMLGAGDGIVKDVVRRVQEVWVAGWEKGRWLNEIERTRSGLAAAVELERTRASAIIWRIYIEFEIKTGNSSSAKKLLYRAIGECPLVKELYLLAFGPLRSVFGAGELHSLADTMAERGLRLRRGLDTVVDGGERVGQNGSSDEHEDEIEHNARELRRLMPY